MFKTTLIIGLAFGLGSLIQSSYAFSPEFNNKNTSNTSVPIVVQKDDNQQPTYPTLELEGFLFQFRGCQATEKHDITQCDLVVTNKQPKRVLSIGNPTRIVDDAGNELIASQFTLGAISSKYGVENELSTDIPVKASVIFTGAIGENIKLFDIKAYVYQRGSFNVEFKS
jgi:hypothetical protein